MKRTGRGPRRSERSFPLPTTRRRAAPTETVARELLAAGLGMHPATLEARGLGTLLIVQRELLALGARISDASERGEHDGEAEAMVRSTLRTFHGPSRLRLSFLELVEATAQAFHAGDPGIAASLHGFTPRATELDPNFKALRFEVLVYALLELKPGRPAVGRRSVSTARVAAKLSVSVGAFGDTDLAKATDAFRKLSRASPRTPPRR